MTKLQKNLFIVLLLTQSIFCQSLWAQSLSFDDSLVRDNSAVITKRLLSQQQQITYIDFDIAKLNYQDFKIQDQNFQMLNHHQLNFTQNIGEPRLPFKAIVVKGMPEEIKVQLEKGTGYIHHITPVPAQEEKCRCDADYFARPQIIFKKSSYQERSLYYKTYLGDFRGTPYTRVTILAAQVNDIGRTTFYPKLKASIFSPIENQIDTFEDNQTESLYDYLIITPASLRAALDDFILYKENQGMRFHIEEIENIGNTRDNIKNFIHSEYQKAHFRYSLIVGSQNLVTTSFLRTQFDNNTPSDYPYYKMGGSSDQIPDVYYGRLIAESPEQVSRQLQKMMNYESAHFSDLSGYLKGVGIASNEGNNPSDNEYILSIQHKLMNAFSGMTYTHFFQNDANSRPSEINRAFNQGINWLTYMGHGSGVSWSSTNRTYHMNDIKNIRNADVVKPIFIDVACQNGKLLPNHAGERLMNETDNRGNAIGATLYYGGSVNISWHPPAIMAKGMGYNLVDQGLRNISEIIFSGHRYLAENYTEASAISDNYRWYHLFGDPSLQVRFQ